METMQISLVQALAPEPSAPEPERTDEFSGILSGKEAENKAESPPGQPPPPVQKPAVEEAEKQEPNAQSQKPDFHCNDETNSDGEAPKETVDVPEGTKTTEGDPQPATNTAVSTPQLAAQTAIAWIGMLPEPTVPVVAQTTKGTITTVKIDSPNIELTSAPAAVKLSADPPATTHQIPTPETPLLEMPAQEAEYVDPIITQSPKVENQAPSAVPATDLYTLIEESPENVEIRVQPVAGVPTNTKTQPTKASIQNPKVEQVVIASQPVQIEAPEMAAPEADEQIAFAPATESTEPAKPVQTVPSEIPKPILKQDQEPTAVDMVKAPATEAVDNAQKVEPEKILVTTETASKGQPAEASKPATKPATVDKPVEKADAASVTEPLRKTANVKNDQAAYSGNQSQTDQDQTAESNTDEIKTEPAQTASVQQTRQEFKLTPDKPATSEKVQQIDSKKTAEVVRQIVDRVETIAATHRPGGVVIRLNPEDLGTITIAVKSIGDQVEAHIVASDDRVRTALDTSRSQLAQAIEAKGFSLKSVTVAETASTQTQGEFANQNRDQAQHQPRQDQQSLRQQANMSTFTYSNAETASKRGGFARTASSGLDLWT